MSLPFVCRIVCRIGLALSLLAVLANAAHASRFGRDGFSGNPGVNGGATCSACHGQGAIPPNVFIWGPEEMNANGAALFSAIVSGGPGVTAGIGVSSTDGLGRFEPLGPNLVVAGEELVHREPVAFSGSAVFFQFRFTAPAINGDVTLYAAANSSNGGLDLIGDGIRTTRHTVRVVNGEEPPPPPPPPLPLITAEPFASGLTRPVVIQSAGDDRLFVVEQPGRIRIVDPDGSVRADPFLDIRGRVLSRFSEQGLLGLAFPSYFAQKGHFFVYYSTGLPGTPGRSRVSRFSVGEDPERADPDSEVVLLEFEQTNVNHNAGDIHFGPDGYLYIASGDGGGGGDPFDDAQDPSSPLGKILRIDAEGGKLEPDCNVAPGKSFAGAKPSYGVPRHNAFSDGPGGEGCDEIYALGLRNPWRMSFDRETGDLWIADVGQNAIEEVSLIEARSPAGANLGWRCFEGDRPFDLSGCEGDYLPPVHVEPHSTGNCSITGGYVYRGSEEPELAGRYFFSDFCNSAIRTLQREGDGFVVEEALPRGVIARPAAFGEDANGEFYVASLGGSLFRIRANDALPLEAVREMAGSPRPAPGPAPLAVAFALMVTALAALGGARR